MVKLKIKNIAAYIIAKPLFFNAICILMLWISFAPVATPDWLRFESQANSILSGNGYRTFGVLEAFLPPVYALFVAGIKYLNGGESSIRIIQILLVLISCNLVYLSVRSFSPRFAFIAGIGFSVHPWMARLAGSLLSETLGVFLCAIFIFIYSRIQRNVESRWELFLFGLVAIIFPLNSPAAIVLSGVLLLSVFWVFISKKFYAEILLITAGAILILIPWQIHCQSVSGNFCYYLYSSNVINNSNDSQKNALNYWFKTWAHGQQDLPVVWGRDLRKAPSRAFNSAAEQQVMLDAFPPVAPYPAKVDDLNSKQVQLLIESSKEKIAKSKIEYYVNLPSIRAFNLWFDMQQIGHIQMDYVGKFSFHDISQDYKELGFARTIARVIKAAASTFVYLIYIAYPIFLIFITAYGVIKREKLVILICGSIFVYTLISAFIAHGESRRNVVFLPAILYLLRFVPSGKNDQAPSPSRALSEVQQTSSRRHD